MTNEERALLLKTICERLPYGLLAKVDGIDEPVKINGIEVDEVDGVLVDFDYKKDDLPLQVYLSELKPYLRPIESMTDAEKREFQKAIETLKWTEELDFYIKHHIDYRGLIQMGLALEAPEGMYNN